MSVWFQINRKIVNKIWFRLDLNLFRKYYSECIVCSYSVDFARYRSNIYLVTCQLSFKIFLKFISIINYFCKVNFIFWMYIYILWKCCVLWIVYSENLFNKILIPRLATRTAALAFASRYTCFPRPACRGGILLLFNIVLSQLRKQRLISFNRAS